MNLFLQVTGSTFFKYDIQEIPERSSYSSNDGGLSYTTNSLNAFGGISSIDITYMGANYNEIVGINDCWDN